MSEPDLEGLLLEHGLGVAQIRQESWVAFDLDDFDWVDWDRGRLTLDGYSMNTGHGQTPLAAVKAYLGRTT